MEPSFFATSLDPYSLHPLLNQYIQLDAVKSAHFNDKDGRYHYTKHGQRVACGGLVETLKYRFCPHYKDNRSKRNWKSNVRGSSKEQGKKIDNQLLEYVRTGKAPKRAHKMTKSLLHYWIKEKKHTLQASQLPVEIEGGWNKMTQADIITRDESTGDLYLWEVKTGFPVGGFRQQDNFKAPLADVKCTKYNIWQLQLHYTRQALEQKGLRFKEANVIQIYEKKKEKELIIKIHPQEDWLSRAPNLAASNHYKPIVL